MSKPSSNLFNLCPWRPTQTQARLVNRGSGWEEKGFECQNRSPHPKKENKKPQVQQQFSEGGEYLQERVCRRLKGRCTCVASWGSCWLRVTAPPPNPTGRGSGRPTGAPWRWRGNVVTVTKLDYKALSCFCKRLLLFFFCDLALKA